MTAQEWMGHSKLTQVDWEHRPILPVNARQAAGEAAAAPPPAEMHWPRVDSG